MSVNESEKKFYRGHPNPDRGERKRMERGDGMSFVSEWVEQLNPPSFLETSGGSLSALHQSVDQRHQNCRTDYHRDQKLPHPWNFIQNNPDWIVFLQFWKRSGPVVSHQ
jgi:hypothetical protein